MTYLFLQLLRQDPLFAVILLLLLLTFIYAQLMRFRLRLLGDTINTISSNIGSAIQQPENRKSEVGCLSFLFLGGLILILIALFDGGV